MRTCSAVLCGVLALVCMRPALAEFYVGIESRSQRAELSAESAKMDLGLGLMDVKPYIDEAEGRNSINAIRVGYVAEIGSDLFLDASVAIGSTDPALAAQFKSPGGEAFFPFGFLDSAFYVDFGAGVRGTGGGMSYTGGLRVELSSVEQDTSATETVELDQRNIAIEGTMGVGEDIRGFVGVGFHLYSGEIVGKDAGATSVDMEFEYDVPLVIFAGIESRGDNVNAFAQVSLIGEELLSTRAGVAVKF